MIHTDCNFFFFKSFFNEYIDDKMIIIKVYIFTFILDTGLNSPAKWGIWFINALTYKCIDVCIYNTVTLIIIAKMKSIPWPVSKWLDCIGGKGFLSSQVRLPIRLLSFLHVVILKVVKCHHPSLLAINNQDGLLKKWFCFENP